MGCVISQGLPEKEDQQDVCVKSLQGHGSWAMETDQSKSTLGLGKMETQESWWCQ